MAADIPLVIGTNKDEATMFVSGQSPTTDAEMEAWVRESYPSNAREMIAALRAAYPGYTPGELATALMGNRMFWIDTIRLAERKLRQRAPVWMYRMDRETPYMGGRLKAGHATELSYVFATYENVGDFVGFGDDPARMSRQMHSAWVSFAATGNPQSPAIPAWPRYDLAERQTMIFDVESRVERDPLGAIRQMMSSS